MGAEMSPRRKTDPDIAKELRVIRRRHPDLAGDTDALRQMEQLASLTVKFRQLDTAIRAAGGAHEATAAMTAELRQLSRACSSLKAQLDRPRFESAPRVDAVLQMAIDRRRLIERAKARALEGESVPVPEPAERPFSVAGLLRQQRKDELDG
jgi:hypothetical protein